jgi:hypothetical protein
MKTRSSRPPYKLAPTLDAGVAADVSRRHIRWGRNAPTNVGGYATPPDRARCETSGAGAKQLGYLLVEALVYIGVVMVLLGVAYAAMYRSIDRSIALRRNADDITSALHAGERWRADVRAAARQVRLEDTEAGQLLYLDGPSSAVVYSFATNAISRRVGTGPWVRLLPNVKFSTMTADRREYVTAWRWELELQTRATASAKPSRIRPLFTFLAVPERPLPK